jgi:isoleucyl-tRNA synthetase
MRLTFGNVEDTLKTLLIVSDACVLDEGSLGASSPVWVYTESLSLDGTPRPLVVVLRCLTVLVDSEDEIIVRVRPATRTKCPRCWTFTAEESETLCERCGTFLGLK